MPATRTFYTRQCTVRTESLIHSLVVYTGKNRDISYDTHTGHRTSR